MYFRETFIRTVNKLSKCNAISIKFLVVINSMIVKGCCIEPLKQKVLTQTDIAHVYHMDILRREKMEIRYFGYVDNTGVLGRNVHDVTLL